MKSDQVRFLLHKPASRRKDSRNSSDRFCLLTKRRNNILSFDEEMFTMIINEASTFAEHVLAPLNVNGDRQGCRIENGAVVTPDGFSDAWKQNKKERVYH